MFSYRTGRFVTSHSAGEPKNGTLRVKLDRRVEQPFHGSTIMSDAGLPAYRELAATPRLSETAGALPLNGQDGIQ